MSQSSGRRTDSLTPDDFRGSSTSADKRREPRIVTERTISIMPCDRDWNTRFQKVKMVDCSLHGVAIVTSLRLEPGERFLAKLRVQERMVLSAYTTRQSIQLGDKYRIGAEFTGLISGVNEDPDEILKSLVAEAARV